RRRGAGCCDLTGSQEWIARPGLNPQTAGSPGNGPTDPSEPGDAETYIGHPRKRASGVVVPESGAHAAVENHDAAEQCQQQRDRAVGHFLDAVFRDVAYPDPPSLRRFRVDVVEAGTSGSDDPERRQPGHVCLNHGLPDEEADDVVTGPWSRPRLDRDVAAVEQLANPIDGKDGRLNDHTPGAGHQSVGAAAVSISRSTMAAGPGVSRAHVRSAA